MMQEIITTIIIILAVSITIYKIIQSLKSFKNSNKGCEGCGLDCDSCDMKKII